MKALWAGSLILAALALVAAAPVAKIQSILAKPKISVRPLRAEQAVGRFEKTGAFNGRFCVVADKGVLWRTLRPFPNTLKLTRDEIVQLRGERVSAASRRQAGAGRAHDQQRLVRLAGGRS